MHNADTPKKAPVSPILIIFLGLTFLIVAIIVGGIIFYKNCEQCQKAVAGIAKGGTAIVEGMNAPGTAEMRALGCDQAMAVKMEVFQKMFAPLAGEEKIFDDNILSMNMLLCKKETFAAITGPECGDVIRAWASGAGEQSRNEALVLVQGRSGNNRYCQGIYALDGTLVQDMKGDF
jgi:hypothetical protein